MTDPHVPHPGRDSVSTIRDDGSRAFVYPSDVRGPFTRARRLAAVLLIAVYAALPWIRINGYPAIFLDVALRRFHLFGLTLAAQDLWLLFFLITGVGFSLFVVTALFGRIWCGWACPQTVFLDHVFRVVERAVEGDAVRRRALAAAGWGPSKVARRLAKHAAYLLLSTAIAHLFLSYFVSIPELWAMMGGAPALHWEAFVFISLATGFVYFDFAWFREQLCIVICPYGRLQSVLTDDHSLVIGYDQARGEPRGVPGRSGAGDCIDCDRCVRVCPTGIDIRHGLQMECIGCAACVDACDEVMRRLGRAPGLVRYDSTAGLAGGVRRWWRPRLGLYAVLMAAGAGAAAWGVAGIRPVLLGVTRMVGAPYYVDDGYVRDQFLVRLTNKRTRPVEIRIDAAGLPAGVSVRGVEGTVLVLPQGEEVRPLIVEQARASYRGAFAFEVRATDSPGSAAASRSLEFLGPDPVGDSP